MSLKNNKKIMVIVAHADDETLGCGGTIARHASDGDIVKVLIMADGVHSRIGSTEDDYQSRCAASIAALAVLGVEDVQFCNLPDNRLDSLPMLDVVQVIEPYIFEFRPHVVYTHHHGDLNIDHRVVNGAVFTACRPQPGFSVTEIYGVEILSSTEWSPPSNASFTPNYFVDISEFLQLKIEALRHYEQEMRKMPHSRSLEHVEALARHRGYSFGLLAAEAFEAYRTLR